MKDLLTKYLPCFLAILFCIPEQQGIFLGQTQETYFYFLFVETFAVKPVQNTCRLG
jgi:hypothetical protein